MDFRRFRARPQCIPITLRDRHHIRGEARSKEIRERLRQRHVLAFRNFDQLVRRVLPVKDREYNRNHDYDSRTRQRKIATKIEHGRSVVCLYRKIPNLGTALPAIPYGGGPNDPQLGAKSRHTTVSHQEK